MDNKDFIRVNERIYKDPNVSTYAFLSYIGLLMHKGISTDKLIFFNTHNVAYQIFGNDKFTRKHLSLFAQGIKELDKSGYIKLSASKHCQYFLAEINNNATDEDKYYICIDIEDFRKVANANKMVCKYYCLLLSLLVGKTAILAGRWTIQTIQELSGLSKDTIYRYNRILSDMQAIFFFDEYVYDKEGKCQSTIFAKWENQLDVEKYVKHYFPFGITHSKYDTNKKRSYAVMYRWLCKGKEYDKDTMLAIKEYVVARNQRIQSRLSNPNIADEERQTLRKKLLDEKIFERQ